MSQKYFYPDTNDQITVVLIKQKEPFTGYWEKSEENVLKLIENTIQIHIADSPNSWLLDSGCGTGRLLPKFQKNFGHILAIDPDSTQIERAKQLVQECGFSDKVVFQTASVEELEWKEGSIDVILCSHILQHVNTETVHRILQKFSHVLKKEGLLFIMTTHSKQGNDYYVKEYLQGSEFVEQRINQAEFNSLVKNDRQILPIHFFSIKNFSGILNDSGFRLLDFRVFHILRKSGILDRIADRDRVANAVSFLKARSGRDMLVIAQKSVK